MTQEPYVDTAVVAKFFSVTEPTVRRWVRTGQLPPSTYISVGGVYRFSIQRIIEALTPKTVEGQEPPVITAEEMKTTDTPVQLELDFGTDRT